MNKIQQRVLLVALLALATPTPLFAAEGGWDSLFAVDPGLMIWTVIVFIVLLVVLGRFAWGPLLSALDEREQKIQGAIDDANAQRAEAQKLLEEHRAQLADARRQAQQMMQDSKDQAAKLRQDLEAKAREDAAALMASARRDIEREMESAIQTVRRESVDVALAAASKLLAERLDGDQDRKIVMSYIDQLTSSEGAQA